MLATISLFIEDDSPRQWFDHPEENFDDTDETHSSEESERSTCTYVKSDQMRKLYLSSVFMYD